ncbi:MAG: OsmC family protein [Bacteroidetes bacterium]|jgi:organic hydroperoxide reductase OsmC/OhrA|nr:OsmC family protein [Bacteroidota bacterium]MBX7128280.1 OsmC family protein [Flavobacteriales bacterium]MCC6653899.1 OsmC family protein [Flavobacteriales bacterium]HMU14763.1 OsmC family protein [Flavobacteriales bacterium]HMW96267.1 OsmC family protein [Flavobacteriales bacterium]
MSRHHYTLLLEWTGNAGTGTDHYRSYKRDHVIRIAGKPELLGSSDTHFRGDAARHNPEELLLAALSACHMMSYLHVCVTNGVVVTAYTDRPTGVLETVGDGGRMTAVTLHPVVTVLDPSMIPKAEDLHHKAHELCFIAASVNFPVGCEAMVRT